MSILAIASVAVFHIAASSRQLAAGELQWRSPVTEPPVVASSIQGAWTQRGQGGHVQVAAATDLAKPTTVNQLRQATHDEPVPFEGPRFAEIPHPENDNSLRPMQSVVVERRTMRPSPARSVQPTGRSNGRPAVSRHPRSTTSIAAATRPGESSPLNPMRTAGGPRRTANGPRMAQQIIDPFEDVMPKVESDAQSEETSEPTITTDSQPPVEPRPFEDAPETVPTEPATDPAKDAMDTGATGSVAPPSSGSVGKYPDFEPKYLEDYSFTEDAERSEAACQKQLSRLKSHTLRPWRDTQKEGWEQRGDEIRDLLNIRAEGTPGADFPFECSTGNDPYEPRQWAPTTYLWKSSALCHKPLYFEDVELERYGHSWGPYAQPLVSAAHFFVTIPILPYKMGLKTPNECVYTLGHYRPGNCAPYLINPIPVTSRAILFEAGTIVGVSAIVP